MLAKVSEMYPEAYAHRIAPAAMVRNIIAISSSMNIYPTRRGCGSSAALESARNAQHCDQLPLETFQAVVAVIVVVVHVPGPPGAPGAADGGLVKLASPVSCPESAITLP